MKFLVILIIFIFTFGFISNAQAIEDGYDKFTGDEDSETIEPKNTFENIIDSPALGVNLIQKVINKVAVWLETYHVSEKLIYIYDEITERGIYPLRIDIGERHGDPPGVEFNYGIYPSRNEIATHSVAKPLSVQYRKEFDISDFDIGRMIEVNTWIQFGFQYYHDYGFQFKLDDILNSGNYLKSTFRYQDSHLEDFFGEGPNISIADGYSFSLEETSVSLALGREFSDQWCVELGGIFSTIDVFEAKDNNNHKRPISQFVNLDGRHGTDLLGLGLSIEHDTRDNEDDPKNGGYQRFKVGYYEGVNGDKYGYTKYRFDIAQYFPVGKYLPFLYWDSALAVRIAGEMNDDLNDDRIPFFDLARLGGGESIRGYQYNRFFDENSLFYSLEYRYNIWAIRDYKVDASVFLDGGWIFDEFSEVEMDKHKSGYGLGFRLIVPRFTLSIQGAHSDDGTEFYAKVNPIF